MERLAQELLDLPRTLHGELILLGQLVHAENRDDVLQRLVLLQRRLNRACRVVMLLADDAWLEQTRGRIERIDCRVDTQLRDRTVEVGRRIEMRERRRRRGIGEIVRGHVHGLHRGDRALVGRRDALLQRAHVGRQRRLIAHGRRNTAEQCRHLCARLREAEDVVDEEQHVLAFDVAEILGDRQARQRDAGACAWRLVHLAEYQRDLRAFRLRIAVGILGDDARVEELVVQIVTLAGTLADAGEHRGAAVALGDVVDQLLDQHGLADAGAAEQADLAALCVGCEQIDDLDPRDQDRALGRLVDEQRCRGMDRCGRLCADGATLVDRLADDVEDAAERLRADGHADLRAGVGDGLAAGQTLGGVHRDRANGVLAKMLGDLEHEPVAVIVGFERRQNGGQVVGEMHVDDGTDDLRDAAGVVRGLRAALGRADVFSGGCHHTILGSCCWPGW